MKRLIHIAAIGHRCNHQDRTVAIFVDPTKVSSQFNPVDLWHLDIKQEAIERDMGSIDFVQRFICRITYLEIDKASSAEHFDQKLQDDRVVIYCKNFHLIPLNKK